MSDIANRLRAYAQSARDEGDDTIEYRTLDVLALLDERDRLRSERDEAQEACRAWQGVYETLEAHLQDRVAMNDPASPETYLSILRSSVARVERDSEQLLKARWSREAELTERGTSLREALQRLVALKDFKLTARTDADVAEYKRLKPEVWRKAREALEDA